MTLPTAYKLLRVRKDGTLGPLFINRKQVIPIGEWLQAEAHYTPGYAFRPGWHCLAKKGAPHLSKKGRVWCRVTVDQFAVFRRPRCQGGVWYLARMMRVDEVLWPRRKSK